MKIELKVELPDGDEVDVLAIQGDMVRFERQYDAAIGEAFQSERLEYPAALAFYALQRTGTLPEKYAGDLDAFVCEVAAVHIVKVHAPEVDGEGVDGQGEAEGPPPA